MGENLVIGGTIYNDVNSISALNENGEQVVYGISPEVEVSEIDGGNRVSFTDLNGTKSIDVMDGKSGYKAEFDGTSMLQPDKYYIFGEVSELSLTLVEAEDDRVHEYCFEFIPTTDSFPLTISPDVKWTTTPQYFSGKTHQVSIVRNVGVMICAV